MKLKKMIFVMICSLCLPFMVNAKEYCKVVSGNGKDIGSEVACGSEHFYIIDSNENEVKMLAKNNLYVGLITYKEEVDMTNETRTIEEVYQDLITEKNADVTSIMIRPFQMRWSETDRENIYECYYNKILFYSPTGELPAGASRGLIPIKEVIQKDDAKSAHSDPNNKDVLGFPQIGDVYIMFEEMELVSGNEEEYGDSFADFNFIPSNPETNPYFVPIDGGIVTGSVPWAMMSYKEYLEDKGYSLNNIDLMSLSEVNNIIKKTNNKSLPIREWTTDPTQTNIFGGLKYDFLTDYLKAGESWLYDGTYWLKTAVVDNSLTPPIQGALFIDSLGAICGSGIRNIPCTQYYQTSLPAGVRPKITISSKELQYLIKTETSEGGSIEVIDSSLGGENISFKVLTERGYKLDSIIVKTDSGEEVEFSEDEITVGEGNVITINKNKFTMPFENVTIQAKLKLENILSNPKTGSKFVLLISILIISFIVGLKKFNKKKI